MTNARQFMAARAAALAKSDNDPKYIAGMTAQFLPVDVESEIWTDRVSGSTIKCSGWIAGLDGFEKVQKYSNLYEMSTSNLLENIGLFSTVEFVYSARIGEPDSGTFSFFSRFRTTSHARGLGEIRVDCGSYGNFIGVISKNGWEPFTDRVHLVQLNSNNLISIVFNGSVATLYANANFVDEYPVDNELCSGLDLAADKSFATIRTYSKCLSQEEIKNNLDVDKIVYGIS